VIFSNILLMRLFFHLYWGLRYLTTLDFPLVVVCHHCRFLQHVTITTSLNTLPSPLPRAPCHHHFLQCVTVATFSNRSLMHIVFLPLVVIIIITAFIFAMMVVIVNNQQSQCSSLSQFLVACKTTISNR